MSAPKTASSLDHRRIRFLMKRIRRERVDPEAPRAGQPETSAFFGRACAMRMPWERIEW